MQQIKTKCCGTGFKSLSSELENNICEQIERLVYSWKKVFHHGIFLFCFSFLSADEGFSAIDFLYAAYKSSVRRPICFIFQFVYQHCLCSTLPLLPHSRAFPKRRDALISFCMRNGRGVVNYN